MTDRELLELAAKAVGLHFSWNEKLECGEVWRDEDKNKRFWQPHRDDGDALRLAVKLGIEIHPDREIAEVITAFCFRRPGLVGLNAAEEFGDDEMVATRRAIVRAAAEIGKGMA